MACWENGFLARQWVVWYLSFSLKFSQQRKSIGSQISNSFWFEFAHFLWELIFELKHLSFSHTLESLKFSSSKRIFEFDCIKLNQSDLERWDLIFSSAQNLLQTSEIQARNKSQEICRNSFHVLNITFPQKAKLSVEFISNRRLICMLERGNFNRKCVIIRQQPRNFFLGLAIPHKIIFIFETISTSKFSTREGHVFLLWAGLLILNGRIELMTNGRDGKEREDRTRQAAYGTCCRIFLNESSGA